MFVWAKTFNSMKQKLEAKCERLATNVAQLCTDLKAKDRHIANLAAEYEDAMTQVYELNAKLNKYQHWKTRKRGPNGQFLPKE